MPQPQEVSTSTIWLLLASEIGRALELALPRSAVGASIDRLEELVSMRVAAALRTHSAASPDPQTSGLADLGDGAAQAREDTARAIVHNAVTVGMVTQGGSAAQPRLTAPLRLDVMQALVLQSVQRQLQHQQVRYHIDASVLVC